MEQARALLEEVRGKHTGHIFLDDVPEDFLVIEEGDWISEHKYEYSSHILKHKPTDTHWMLGCSRSGSYYTDYYYDRTEIQQVTPVQEVVTVTKWMKV